MKAVRRTDRDYISGPQLHSALKIWYDSGEEQIPEEIFTAIIQICTRLGTKHNFRNYSYLDEMVGDAIVSCIKALNEKKYDPDNFDNPFAYFTQIAYNEFRKIIKSEHKEAYIKHKSMQMYIIDSTLNGETIEIEDDGSGRLDNLVNKFEGKKDEQ